MPRQVTYKTYAKLKEQLTELRATLEQERADREREEQQRQADEEAAEEEKDLHVAYYVDNLPRLAIYLTGQLPPHYGEGNIDKLHLIDLCRKHSEAGFTEDFFKVMDKADSQQFYRMVLNRIYRLDPAGYRNLILSLNLPKAI